MKKSTLSSPRARRLAGALACAFALVGTMTSAAVAQPAGSNQAAASCNFDGVDGHWYCRNRPGIGVEWAGQTFGYLNGTVSWFTCRYEGDPTGGGPHPNRWIYTLADTPHYSHGGWGFVKDSDVDDETNPLPRC
ncbi:hypothetical protein [Streptomyces pseudovenezuelae]|uniref:hypothetical protein n=1 Tax=Streptomyces pseudovenezuelae TaxID=67350 RepID=UPI0036E6A6CB